MATSGSTDFATTRAQLISFALRQVNAIAAAAVPSAAQAAATAYKLNAMVKSWQATGLQVWTVTEGVLFPNVGQARYGMGGAATDRAAGPFVQTSNDGAASAGATVITVASELGIANGYEIGLQLDDGSLQWTTVANVAGTVVTLAEPLDDSVSDKAAVFAYPTKIVRPLKIVDARVYNLISQQETPITLIARRDYQALNDKAATGKINQAFYDPQLGTGYLHLWQPPTIVEDIVKFTWWRPIEDFDSTGDSPDLPQEWIAALNWNLALELTVEYPVADRIYQRILLRATETLDAVRDFGREEGSVFFQPARY